MLNFPFERKELPSFMRIKYLKDMEAKDNLKRIIYNDTIVGFYVLEGSMFKNLYIKPDYRRLHLATDAIKNEMCEKVITIATTKRSCCIRRIIQKLGFKFTGQVVVGKQSPLEIWRSPVIE